MISHSCLCVFVILLDAATKGLLPIIGQTECFSLDVHATFIFSLFLSVLSFSSLIPRLRVFKQTKSKYLPLVAFERHHLCHTNSKGCCSLLQLLYRNLSSSPHVLYKATISNILICSYVLLIFASRFMSFKP